MAGPPPGQVRRGRTAGGARPHARGRFRGGKFRSSPGAKGLPSTGGSTRTCSGRCSASTPPSEFRRDEVTMKVVTYDEMRPGSYEVKPRLEDMDANHIEASLCFPTFPRFCGQTFSEAKDKELGLLCVRAYNDWMVDEWCARLGRPADPAVPDPAVGRRAGRGRGAPQRRPRRARRLLQRDPALPRPAVRARHDHYWDPFFAACDETGPSSTCTSGRRRRCRRRRPTPRRRWARR